MHLQHQRITILKNQFIMKGISQHDYLKESQKNIEQVDNLGQLIQNRFHFYLITHVFFFQRMLV